MPRESHFSVFLCNHNYSFFDLKVPLGIPKGDACLSKKATKGRVLISNFLLVFINWCTIRKCFAVRLVQRLQVYLVEADAQPYGHDGS